MFWLLWRNFLYGNNASLAKGGIAAPTYKSETPVTANTPETILAALGNDIFCIIDESLVATYLSQNWQVITGMPVQASLGNGVRKRIQSDHIEAITTYLLSADNKTSAIRFLMQHADECWNWYELRLIETTKQETSAAGFKCLLSNVNELVEAQENYEKAKLEADVANKLRSEFLANMNHELRTPLNAIIGFAQIMESGIYGDMGHPKYVEYVNNIQASGMTLLSKLSDLMEIANIDAGRMTLEENECDLVAIMHDAIELHSHTALLAHVELRENLPDRPIMAVVDRVRMLQVIANVLSNAVKHNRQGGTVDVYCEKRKDGAISMVVEDTGKGIGAAHLDDILTAFGQDNSFFARSRDCVGLGLALSKEIVKLHEGRIEIESRQGEGTVLKIVLPAKRLLKNSEARGTKIQNLSAAS